MANQKVRRPASVRQLAYIKRLQAKVGEHGAVLEGISSAEASELIGELMLKASQNGAVNAQGKINEPRLGMAMKETFRLWTGLGRDIWGEKREAFKTEAIRTYHLFTEIAERVEQDSRAAV